MSTNELKELIFLAHKSKKEEIITRHGCQHLVDWIIEELKKIQLNPKHEFSEVLRRRLTDSSFPWESKLNKHLVIFLDKYDAQRKKSKK